VEQLAEIMSPLVPAPSSLGDAPVRSVGGLGQIMHAESRYVFTLFFVIITIVHYGGMFIFGMVLISSRDAYAQLTTAPILKPLDWTRSRVRREHLISMGVPVNLDEVCPCHYPFKKDIERRANKRSILTVYQPYLLLG